MGIINTPYQLPYKYETRIRVTKEFLSSTENVENIDELIKRDLVKRFISELPMDIIEKIFKIKKIDPSTKENQEIINLSTDITSEIQLLRYLERIECIEFNIEL